MADLTEHNTQENKELDLLDLIVRFFRWFGILFKGIGFGIMKSIAFLFRNWIPLGLSIILGAILTYAARSFSEPTYKSDLVLKANAVQSTDLIEYINKLHLYCHQENLPALENALSLNDAEARNIIDVNAYWIIDKGIDGVPDKVDYNNRFNVYDTLNSRMLDRLDIQAIVKSPADFPVLQSALENYIAKDSLFQEKNRVRLMHNKELIVRLDYDIQQLDSLQKVKYFEETRNRMPKNGGQFIFMQEQKTQLVYTDIYDLYRRKQDLESERTLYKGISTVLSSFTTPLRRENGMVFYGSFIIPICFFLTIFVLILLKNKSRIKATLDKY